MNRTTKKLFAGALLVAMTSPSWAIPIVGTNDSINNTADFDFSVVSASLFRVELANTSNFDARITGFGFNLSGGTASGLVAVSGTLDNSGWSFSLDAIPGPGDRDAFAITGMNLNGGDPLDAIAVTSTGIFDFSGAFAGLTGISDILVRFQQTGADGEGSDRGTGCTSGCTPPPPPVTVPEPGSLMLLGLGLATVGFVSRRRRLVRD